MKACRLLLFVLSFPFAVVAHTPEAVAKTPEAEVLTLVTRLGGSVTAAAAPGSPIVASDLHGSAVTDAGVLSLGAMQQLKVLLLGRTAVSAEAMSALQASLPDLVFAEAT